VTTSTHHVSFDAEDFIRQMRAAADHAIAAARASVTDPVQLAGFEAQHALWPAHENFARVYLGLREAGRNEYFVAAIAASLAASFLIDIRLNSTDPAGVTKVFIRNLCDAVSGKTALYATDISTDGVPMGRA
jgi:hypothetical protein